MGNTLGDALRCCLDLHREIGQSANLSRWARSLDRQTIESGVAYVRRRKWYWARAGYA